MNRKPSQYKINCYAIKICRKFICVPLISVHFGFGGRIVSRPTTMSSIYKSDGFLSRQRFCQRNTHLDIKGPFDRKPRDVNSSLTPQVISFTAPFLPPFNDIRPVVIGDKTQYIICGPVYGLLEEFANLKQSRYVPFARHSIHQAIVIKSIIFIDCLGL